MRAARSAHASGGPAELVARNNDSCTSNSSNSCVAPSGASALVPDFSSLVHQLQQGPGERPRASSRAAAPTQHDHVQPFTAPPHTPPRWPAAAAEPLQLRETSFTADDAPHPSYTEEEERFAVVAVRITRTSVGRKSDERPPGVPIPQRMGYQPPSTPKTSTDEVLVEEPSPSRKNTAHGLGATAPSSTAASPTKAVAAMPVTAGNPFQQELSPTKKPSGPLATRPPIAPAPAPISFEAVTASPSSGFGSPAFTRAKFATASPFPVAGGAAASRAALSLVTAQSVPLASSSLFQTTRSPAAPSFATQLSAESITFAPRRFREGGVRASLDVANRSAAERDHEQSVSGVYISQTSSGLRSVPEAQALVKSFTGGAMGRSFTTVVVGDDDTAADQWENCTHSGSNSDDGGAMPYGGRMTKCSSDPKPRTSELGPPPAHRPSSTISVNSISTWFNPSQGGSNSGRKVHPEPAGSRRLSDVLASEVGDVKGGRLEDAKVRPALLCGLW